MADDDKARRVIDTLTGPWEKKHLPQMAAALPGWVTSDHLTLLGILCSLLIAAGYALTRVSLWWLWLSNFGLFVHWYADSLDGTLARVRHRERERYGYLVDHICDAWTALVLCLGLGMSRMMDMRVALFLAATYLLLNIHVHIMAYVQKVFRISFGRFGPTEVRILIFIVNIALIFWNPRVTRYGGDPITALDLFGLALAIVFVIIFAVSSIKDAIELDKLDRAGWKDQESHS
ncbi:CDP-alcohol phosphatidyltransferase family protein [Candidatus Zixiibacteriota bacterium]